MPAIWDRNNVSGGHMSLKFELDSLEGLDESVSSLYTEKDGKFVLGIEGLPDFNSLQQGIDALKSKNEELLSEKKREAQKRKEIEEQARLDAEEAARKGGDTEALDKSWQEKYASREAELLGQFEPKISELEGLLHKKTVMAEAMGIASEIAVPGSSQALLPHLQSRLAMEIKDGEAVTVVRSIDGKPSALTLDELKNEFINNPVFAPLIVGSKASGGGADGSNQGGGAAKTTGKLTGNRDERRSAIAGMFPDLEK